MKRDHNTRIVFRADGNSSIGLGHVVRLLSLVDMCKNEFDCLFIIRQPAEKITDLIKRYCDVCIISGPDELDEINKILRPADIVVLDGYHFDSLYQKNIRSLVSKLVAIDDKGEIHFYADLVINHGGEYIKDKYSKESYTKILAGFRYLILRNEFLNAALKGRTVTKVDTAYICMGGADPFNITIKAIQACSDCSFINKIIVITGSAYSNRTELLTLVESVRHSKHIIHENSIDADRMVQLISESDIAICPSSAVAIEVCCVKAGLLTGTVIDNQDAIHQQLLQGGCCISLGDFNKVSVKDMVGYLEQLSEPTVINKMLQKQSAVIDGHSAERILSEIRKLAA